MSAVSSPVLDPRGQQALLSELQNRVPGFLLPWRARAPDAGWALLFVYARYLEILGSGINKLPGRSLLAFLETFGTSLLPAQSARVPLVFELLATSPSDVTLPSQSTVAAKLPPPPPSMLSDTPDSPPDPPLFYTTQTVTLTRSKLVALYSIDPNDDLYTDHSAQIQSGFVAFDNRDPVPHVLYIGHDRLFALAGSAEVALSFSMIGTPRSDGRKLVLTWEYLSADGWLPLQVKEDTTARFTADGQITLVKDCGPDSKQDAVGGQTSYWVRATVSSDPPRATITALACGQIAVDAVPAGAAKGDALIVAGQTRSTVDGIVGNIISLESPALFTVGETVNVAAKGNATVTVAAVTFLQVDAAFRFQPGDRVTIDGETTASLTTVFNGELELDQELPQAAVSLRVSLADAIPPLRPEGVDSLGPLPMVDVIHARVGFTKSGLQAEQGYFDTVPLDLANRFYPFGKQPETFATFYVASKEAFQRQGAEVHLEFSLAKKGTTLGGAALVWEYFNGDSWQQIGALNDLVDGTAALTQDGVLSFTAPEDWAQSEVNGDKNYWLRARLENGDYGHPMQLKVVTDSAGNLTVQIDDATLAPPVVASLALRYTYFTEIQLVDHCFSYNDFHFTDHSEDARWLRRPFTPFTPVADRDVALQFGFSEALPSGLVSLYVDAANAMAVAPPTSPFVWEYLSVNGWRELVVLDETQGFAASGMIQWVGPPDAVAADGLGGVLYRVRARLKPAERVASTPLRAVWPNAVWAVQGEDVQQFVLGDSNGNPDQTFALPANRIPVLPGERLEVREWTGHGDDWQTAVQGVAESDLRFERDAVDGTPTAVWVRWAPCDEFYEATPSDRVYQPERASGLFRFGDGIAGLIPPAGSRIATSFSTGGGIAGNVPRGTITELRTGIAYLQGVTNPIAATGGAAVETLDEVTARGPQRLRHRERSVAASDYEWLAREASPDLARVRCLPLTGDDGHPERGWVTLLMVPQSSDPQPQPTPQLAQRVRDFIASHCPATVNSRVRIAMPVYMPVSVQATLVPTDAHDAARIEQAVRAALNGFLHPLSGGVDGHGWEFGDTVYLSQIATLLEGIEGVDYTTDLALSVANVSYGASVTALQDQLLAAGPHSLKILAMAVAAAPVGVR